MNTQMNLKRIVKFCLSIVLFSVTISAYAQITPTHFNNNLPIRTGYNYSAGAIYTPGFSNPDNYWKVLAQVGNTFVTANAYRMTTSWVAPINANYQWISTDVQPSGKFYYRLNFCIDALLNLNGNMLTGGVLGVGSGVSADNTINSIRIDGVEVINFNQAAICPGQGSRAYDFACSKTFDVPVSQNLLSIGNHTLEVEIYNNGSSFYPNTTETGLLLDAVLSGVSGYIIPFTNTSNIAGCSQKGQIRGLVFNDINSNGIKDGTESTISDVDVSLYTSGGANIKTIKTDNTGAYNFYGLDISVDYVVRFVNNTYYNLQTFPVNPNYHNATFTGSTNFIVGNKDFGVVNVPNPPCTACKNGFAPIPGKDYVISAWVKEGSANTGALTYSNAGISVSFTDLYNLDCVGAVIYNGSGDIIDGWQRIEAVFTVPTNAVSMSISLSNSGTGEAFFDDIRVHPFDASLKSFVYDPKTLRLAAELDERNYATFYEYNDNGELMLVKKETAKGIMTIKESRNASRKKP